MHLKHAHSLLEFLVSIQFPKRDMRLSTSDHTIGVFGMKVDGQNCFISALDNKHRKFNGRIFNVVCCVGSAEIQMERWCILPI